MSRSVENTPSRCEKSLGIVPDIVSSGYYFIPRGKEREKKPAEDRELMTWRRSQVYSQRALMTEKRNAKKGSNSCGHAPWAVPEMR